MGGRGFFQWLCLRGSRLLGRGTGRRGRGGSSFVPGGERGGAGDEDPIFPPRSRPLGRAPPMGLGEGAGSAPRAQPLHQLRGPAPRSGIAGPPCACLAWRAVGEDARIGKEAASARGVRNRQAGDAFPQRRHRDSGCTRLPPPRERQGVWPPGPASQGSASLPSQRPAVREELRKAGTGAGGGAGWERSREHRCCTDKKHRMAGERSAVTSLFGQSTGLTAPQREDIR